MKGKQSCELARKQRKFQQEGFSQQNLSGPLLAYLYLRPTKVQHTKQEEKWFSNPIPFKNMQEKTFL